jgi:hypothetical protein
MPSANELRPAIDWQEIRDQLNRHPERDARYEVACWALSTLQEQLGDSWLKRASTMDDGDFPLGLHLLSGHTHALAEDLEWACRSGAVRARRTPSGRRLRLHQPVKSQDVV